MFWRGQSYLVYGVWATLAVAFVWSLAEARWSMGFVALVTFLVTLVPGHIAARYGVRVPMPFLSGVVLFIFATLFLGEAVAFYERYWWWDIALHGLSAVGFGMVGFIFIFVLFQGDRYAAPAWAVAFLGWCFAVAMGVSWEIFEFLMDQSFGLNMQKSGLIDTMWDLIVDLLGGAIGAGAGFLYLIGREEGGLPWLIGEFVRLNRRFFSRLGRRR